MKRIILFASVLLLAASSLARSDDCTLKLGVVPQFEQRKLISIWNPIMEALSTKLACRIEFVGSENIQAFETQFTQGEFDIAYLNPYHALMAFDAQGYEPIIRSSANLLSGILVARKDSSITDIQQLQGMPIAFPSPNALGASLLMRAELKTLHNIDVIPKYVKTHTSVYLHVAKKQTVAGGGVLRTLKSQSEPLQDRLHIIYETQKVNSHPIVVHPRAQKYKEAIQMQLLALGDQQLLDEVPMQAPIASSLDDYLPLRELQLEKFVE